MTEPATGGIAVGWLVSDASGRKVGRIVRLHQPVDADAESPDGTASPDEVMEVSTGLLGLGRRVYIPLGAIRAATNGHVLLTHTHEDFSRQGWLTKFPGA
jgi:hypothetical protein